MIMICTLVLLFEMVLTLLSKRWLNTYLSRFTNILIGIRVIMEIGYLGTTVNIRRDKTIDNKCFTSTFVN